MSDSLRGQLLVASPGAARSELPADGRARRRARRRRRRRDRAEPALRRRRSPTRCPSSRTSSSRTRSFPSAGQCRARRSSSWPSGTTHEEAGAIVFDDVGLMGAEAELERVAASTRRVRIFAGYAGWSGGQLEAELAEPSWIVEDAEARTCSATIPTSGATSCAARAAPSGWSRRCPKTRRLN